MKNDAQLSIGNLILIIVAIIIIVAMMWFVTLPPSCDIEDQVQLQGVLMGFEKNNTGTGWDVLLDNITYHFNYFDKSYMEKLISHNITINCCDRGKHFDFLSAFINEVD